MMTGIGPKPRKAPFKKPEAIKSLEHKAMESARKKYPSHPEYVFAPRKFRDDTANGLTGCITSYIGLAGGFASRVNNGGVFDSRIRKFRPGTSRKGLADVMATYKGLSLHIKVKIGKDIQSEHQRQVELDVIMSGGYYFIALNYTEFKNWFDNL